MTAIQPDRRLRILLINWQDKENPEAGGAEVHLHEIFGRLAARGHEVRAVVGGWPGSPARATVDGISLTRCGGRHTFPLVVRGAVRRALADGQVDVVVEDINKVPLYTPLWVRAPIVGLVPHLFGATAYSEASWPLATLVWGSERLIPFVYRDTPFQVISEGTADDLVGRGIARDRITVIPPGIDHTVFRPPPETTRASRPTMLYLGRLKRYKGLDVVLQALARLRTRIPELQLEIAGRGDDRERIEKLVDRLGIGECVKFLGFVPENEKIRRIQRAWVAVYPSPKEGWGIVNVEAAACGTPVVASDSPGLRESVAPGVSGLLVPHDDVNAWVVALESLLAERSRVEAMRKGCVEHAEQFSWDRAARETEEHLQGVLATRVNTDMEPDNR